MPLIVTSFDKYLDFFNFSNPYSVDIPSLDAIPATPQCLGCPRVYYPICADDNMTYVNECRMNCVNENRQKNPKAKFVRTGPCEVFPDLK